MGAGRARSARITATAALLACLVALLAPLTSAQAAAVHRPAGAVAVTTAGPNQTGPALGATFDAVSSHAGTGHALVATDIAAAHSESRSAQHSHDSTAPRGPPGRRQ